MITSHLTGLVFGLFAITIFAQNDTSSSFIDFTANQPVYLSWKFTPNIKSRSYRTYAGAYREGAAYLEYSPVRRSTFLGELVADDYLAFAISMWMFGMKDRAVLKFTYSPSNFTMNQPPASYKQISWYFYSKTYTQNHTTTLNHSHLEFLSENGVYSFQQAYPTNPYYLLVGQMACFAATFFLTKRLCVMHEISSLYSHRLAYFGLFGKQLVIPIMTAWTSMTTLPFFHSLIFHIVLSCIITLSVYRFRIESRIYQRQIITYNSFRLPFIKLDSRHVLQFLAVAIFQLVMFGSVEYQCGSCLVLLSLQLWRKYSIPTLQRTFAEDRYMVLQFLCVQACNHSWMTFKDNFYRIPAPRDSLFAYYCVAVLLCLALMLPKYQRAPKHMRNVELGRCKICTVDIGTGNIFLGECGHKFHTECVSNMLLKKQCCPIDSVHIDYRKYFFRKNWEE